MDESTIYVPINLHMVNNLLIMEHLEIQQRETLEVQKRIKLFDTEIKKFNPNEDDLLDDIREVHMVETSVSSQKGQHSKVVAQVTGGDESDMP